MSWQTSSSLERVDLCPASVVLPGTPHQGPEAAYGTRNHDKAEHGDLPPRLEALTLECVQSFREVAMVLDVQKRAVVRTAYSARDYGTLATWEIGTTPDFIGSLANGVWRVRDWKSRKLVTTPRQNPQLISQALAVFAHFDAAAVDAGFGYLSHDEDDACTFTAFDAPDLWERLRRILEKGHNAKPDQIRESDQCTYCRCLMTCPAKKRALATIGIEIPETLDHIPAEAIGELRHAVQSYRKILDRYDEQIEQRAKREPIPLGGGKELRLIECNGRKQLDRERVAAYLESHGEDIDNFQKVGQPYNQLKEVRIKP